MDILVEFATALWLLCSWRERVRTRVRDESKAAARSSVAIVHTTQEKDVTRRYQ